MIPKAKKNLHECEYHLNNMMNSLNVEELEINFAAFVNSGRNVTFVLRKEFNSDDNFSKWYKIKQDEMGSDELCKFFKELRNHILKEGINNIECDTTISRFNSSEDMVDRPKDSELKITGKGIFYLVNNGTPQEDLIPAKTKAQMMTTVFIKEAPKTHLGKTIPNNNIIEISKNYYLYLKILVEEWTGIINK
jgi:hypothetical protein